jgi:hypothetical protein
MVSDSPATDLTRSEREALHRLTLGMEWLHRAHGHLLAFHHCTGHAMDHVAQAETLLREAGHDGFADAIRDEYLHSGVIDDDRWSYDVVEDFQSGIYSDLQAFETAVREEIADGQRHVAERVQEQAWKERARNE